MKGIPILLVFYLFGFSDVSGQESIQVWKDSLRLEVAKKDRVRHLLHIVGHYAKRGQLDRDSIRAYNLQLLHLLEDETVTREKAKAKAYQLLSDYNSPYNVYAVLAKDLIQDYKYLGMYEGVLKEQFYLANKAHMAGESESFTLYEQGLTMLEEYTLSLDASVSCKYKSRYTSSLASNFDYVGLYDDAIETALSAISIAETCKDSMSLLYAYRSAGAIIGNAIDNVHYDAEGWTKPEQKLIYFLQKTKDMAIALGQNEVSALACYNLAYYYNSRDSVHLAKKLLEESWAIPDIRWMLRQQYLNHTLTATILQKEGDKRQSLQELLEAHESAVSLNEALYFFKSQIRLAQWHLQEGLYERALVYLTPLDTLLKDNIEMRMEYHQAQSQLNIAIKKYQKANHHLELYHNYKDSISNAAKAHSISALMRRYDISVADKKIALLESRNMEERLQFQRNIGFGMFGLMTVLGIAVFIISQYRQRLTRSKYEKQHVQQQLFRVQMNPHFIFNTLGSIQGFLLNKGKAKEAAYYLTKFAKLMRRILSQSQKESITLEEEVETLSHYLMLQRMRFDEQFNYNIDIEESINMAKVMVPPMILQPIIENAIEHGRVYNEVNGIIDVDITKREDGLSIRIIDNGVGMSQRLKHSELSKESFALSAIKRRLNYLSSNLNKLAWINFDAPTSGGTVVHVLLPITE